MLTLKPSLLQDVVDTPPARTVNEHSVYKNANVPARLRFLP